jgi:hypothetical protein
MKTLLAHLLALRMGLLAAAWALASCGGGVGTGGTGGDATAYAAGPITGFGSVFVGGVRFDDSAATVEDADGGGRNRDELRLGMTVEIDSSAISTDSSGSTASARRIHFESEIQGLVGLVNAGAGTFTVLGQTVLVDATTVFDDRIAGGLAGLSTGQGVEVYAVFDAAALRYRATRVEPSSLSGGLRLRGPVRVLDAAAQTLTVGSNSYSYAGANNLPVGLAVGQFVPCAVLAPLRGRWRTATVSRWKAWSARSPAPASSVSTAARWTPRRPPCCRRAPQAWWWARGWKWKAWCGQACSWPARSKWSATPTCRTAASTSSAPSRR